jgi:hypothetical protein
MTGLPRCGPRAIRLPIRPAGAEGAVGTGSRRAWRGATLCVTRSGVATRKASGCR